MTPDLRADNDVKLYGQVDHFSCEIRIKPGQDPQQQRQTEWHEIVHVMLEQMGCNDDINNEAFTTALAHVLMQVAQDNPWLAEEAK
jgi:hypothetical protein